MATVEVHGPHTHETEQTAKEWATGGSAVEAVAGIAAVVLAVIGLATMHSPIAFYLAAIAVICVGAALFCGGTGVISRAQHMMTPVAGAEAGPGGGMAMQFLGGVAGVVLGILALINVAPLVLMAVAAIALGAAWMLSCGAATRSGRWTMESYFGNHETARLVARELVQGASGVQVLAGLAAIVLGIIALVGYAPLTLTLTAFLCLGASALLSGGALTERVLSVMTR